MDLIGQGSQAKVYKCMEKEIRECFENSFNKKNIFIPTGDNVWPIWTYVIINADVNNLITECDILQDFKIKDSSLQGSSDYHLTNMLAAVEEFKKKEIGQNKFTNITTYFVSSNTFVPEEPSGRSMSFGKTGISDEEKSTNTNSINAIINI